MDEKNMVIDFWQNHGIKMLRHLIAENLPIYVGEKRLLDRTQNPSHMNITTEDGIVFVRETYIKPMEGERKTEWLQRPLDKKGKLQYGCIWTFRPIEIRPNMESPFDPRKATYIYLMRKIVYGQFKEVEYSLMTHVYTRLDGTVKNLEKGTPRERGQTHYEFIFSKQFIAKMNLCLLRNYLSELWRGGVLAFWTRADESALYYMGTHGATIEVQPDFTEHLKKICTSDAGVVLIAYTCFSLLSPFFSSYHRLNRQSSYLKVKKGIQNLIAVNVRGTEPKFVEELAKCCCNYFCTLSGPIVDGIRILKNASRYSKLGIDEFEKNILQPACILWVNRAPTEELVNNGRLINLQVDFSPIEKGFTDISAQLIQILADAYYENTLNTKENNEKIAMQIEKNKKVIVNFINQVVKLAEATSISLKNFNSEKERCISQKFKYGDFSVKYLRELVRRIKYYKVVSDQPDLTPNPYEKERNSVFKKETNRLYHQAMNEIKRNNNEVALFLPYEYIRKNAEASIFSDEMSKNLSKGVIKKLSYLLASFRIFTALCLTEEDDRSLYPKIRKALIATLINQTGYNAKKILENHLFNLIRDGRCARIRGAKSDGDDIAVWYDPKNEAFLLPARTYFILLKNECELLMTKAQFENELEQSGVICTVDRKSAKRRQSRKTFECVLRPKGHKVSVLKIPQKNLSHSFVTNDVVEWAIKELHSDSTPLRSRKN